MNIEGPKNSKAPHLKGSASKKVIAQKKDNEQKDKKIKTSMSGSINKSTNLGKGK